MSNRTRWILLAGLAVVVACGSDNGATGSDGGTDSSDLSFPMLGGDTPALCSTSAGAWFYKTPGGPDQEIALEFPENGHPDGCTTGETEDFFRLRLKGSSLFRFPDNSLIANGDSVFISVTWVGNDSILFVLQPSGLQFDSDDPAELKIEYDHCNGDFNGDGDDDHEDDDIENKLDIWRQERPQTDWFRVGTAKIKENKEIDAKLNGFSRFALAY